MFCVVFALKKFSIFSCVFAYMQINNLFCRPLHPSTCRLSASQMSLPFPKFIKNLLRVSGTPAPRSTSPADCQFHKSPIPPFSYISSLRASRPAYCGEPLRNLAAFCEHPILFPKIEAATTRKIAAYNTENRLQALLESDAVANNLETCYWDPRKTLRTLQIQCGNPPNMLRRASETFTSYQNVREKLQKFTTFEGRGREEAKKSPFFDSTWRAVRVPLPKPWSREGSKLTKVQKVGPHGRSLQPSY